MFYGDITKWREFWDSFKSAIHSNTRLSEIDKLNYLRAKLSGEALGVIRGMELSSQNYEVAIGLLKERYSDERKIIRAHYNALMNVQAAPMDPHRLQMLTDEIEMHLRSLEALGERLQDGYVLTLFESKLPKEVNTALELLRGEAAWTLDSFRAKRNFYLKAIGTETNPKIPEYKPFSKSNSYRPEYFERERNKFDRPPSFARSGTYRPTQTML